MISDLEYYRVKDNVNSYYRIESESKKELLLNKYPNAAAAYSLRLLDGYYRGPLVRVRREGGGEGEDGVEVDVYPDYNNQLSLDSLVTNVPDAEDTTTTPDVDEDYTFQLSLSSLGEFVGATGYSSTISATNATVCVWYDQSSTDGVANDNDASQSVATNQPLIVSSGVIVTENGKAAVNFDGSNDVLTGPNFINGSGDRSVFIIYQTNLVSSFNSLFDLSTNSQLDAGGSYTLTSEIALRCRLATYVTTVGNTNQSLMSVTQSSSVIQEGVSLYYNGLIANRESGGDGTINTDNSDFQIMGGQNRVGEGFLQEIIVYASDQSTNRTDIEEDINNHYQIEGYTPPEPLIDLTKRLATEAGDPESEGTPAAAYSLRKLSSGYSDPLVRVRRSTDNTEVDVYADDKGAFSLLSTIKDGGDEISTGVTGGSTTKTKLYEFVYGQACDLTVVVWYDQSSNNDATQEATGSQPKIYDSVTGVVTENGKPAVDFNLNKGLGLSVTMTRPVTAISVDKADNAGDRVSGILIQTAVSESSNTSIYNGAFLRAAGNTINSQKLVAAIFNGASSYLDYRTATSNASASGSAGTLDATVVNIGNRDAGNAAGTILQELIFWSNNDQTSNLPDIKTNINDYYTIF